MSTLLADTIRKTGGTAGVDIRVKNTSVYESDGGTSVTQNIVQSLGKSWVNWNGTSTVAVRDSLNHSSLTDNGTGDYTVTISSAMSNASYCRSGMCGLASNSQECISQAELSTPATTTAARYVTAYANTSMEDVNYAGVVLHGDLA
jgi:hypothetical protein|tara:strand:- start:392 stop:829 length:438 start_codon:yes stop_codon:yes gene_type:complete